MDPNETKFNNMKSHNCHVFMETLLPIVFGALPDDAIPTAYQQTDMTTIVEPVNDAILTSLVDESVPTEEVNDEMSFSVIQVNDEIDEVEDDGGDEKDI